MKEKISSHFHYNWVKYVMVFLLSIVVWVLVFDSLSAPKANEKIGISFFGGNIDEVAFSQELHTKLPELTSQGIDKISVDHKEDTAYFYEVMMGKIVSSDIIIVSEELFVPKTDDFIPENYFRAIPDNKLIELFGEDYEKYDYYKTEDGKIVGVYLSYPNDGMTNNFEKIYSGESKYVLFFSHETVNSNGLYGKGEEGDRAAIDIMQYLLDSK